MSIEHKIDRLIEESLRQDNLALIRTAMTPEQINNIATTQGQLTNAFRAGVVPGAVSGMIGGGIGGGIVAGLPGAALGAGIGGAGVGIGSGIGQYINARSLANMDPKEAKKIAIEAEKMRGKEYSDKIRSMAKSM
jgi:uncharacterized membrane protein